MSYLALNDDPLPDVKKALQEWGVDPETIAAVDEWLNTYPEVWMAFESKAIRLHQAGVKRFGAKAIFEAIRYDRAVKGGDDFKANNNYPSYCARLFVWRYPECQKLFEFRRLKGLKGQSLKEP